MLALRKEDAEEERLTTENDPGAGLRVSLLLLLIVVGLTVATGSTLAMSDSVALEEDARATSGGVGTDATLAAWTDQAGSQDGAGSPKPNYECPVYSPTGSDGQPTADQGAGENTLVAQGNSSHFAVSIDSTNSPVSYAETLNVTVTVTNTGNETDTQEISLSIEDHQADSATVMLASGESRTLHLRSCYNSGTHLATVESDDDTTSTEITREEPPEPPDYEIRDLTTNSPVPAGETFVARVTIENVGGVGTAPTRSDVGLLINWSLVNSTRIRDADGKTATVLSWQTDRRDVGTYLAIIETQGDQRTTQIRVERTGPPHFNVTLDSTPSQVLEGEPVNVTATVENLGFQAGTQTVDLSVDDQRVETRRVELSGGQSTSVSFQWDTESGDAGQRDLAVTSANTTANTSVEVEEVIPPTFDVSFERSNSSVLTGGVVGVTTRITNSGDLTGTQAITMTIDGDPVDRRMLTLGSGASELVTLTWHPGHFDVGNHGATVASVNDSVSTVIDVEQADTPTATASPTPTDTATPTPTDTATPTATPTDSPTSTTATTAPGTPDSDGAAGHPGWVVDIESTEEPRSADEQFTVEASITNEGPGEETQTIRLTVDGEQRDTETLTLGPGDSRTVTFSWDAGDGEGSTVAVASEDDEATASVGPRVAGGGQLPLPLPLLIGLLLVLLVVAVGGYVYRRR